MRELVFESLAFDPPAACDGGDLEGLSRRDGAQALDAVRLHGAKLPTAGARTCERRLEARSGGLSDIFI